MTRFLANWEVESDAILPDKIPVIRHQHPGKKYSVFLRNETERRSEGSYLSMQMIFDAPHIKDAEEIGTPLAKEFLEYLSFVTNMKVRLRNILHIFNWEPGPTHDGMREAFYFARTTSYDQGPYDVLEPKLFETIGQLQAHPVNPRLRRAIKWFGNGIASRYQDDQFSFFWFAVELIAQIIKEPSPVPDRCPKCKGPLYCTECTATPLHRPYPKQAIQQLFEKYGPKDGGAFYRLATDARNMLMHGDEVDSIEESLGTEFNKITNDMGRLAWVSIINQFASVFKADLEILSTNKFVHMVVHGSGHVRIGFNPDLENPDPTKFPKAQVSIEMVPRAKQEGVQANQ